MEIDMQEMEMPTPCNECGEIFDLNDGMRHPRGTGIVICAECGRKIESEVEREEEIDTLEDIPDADIQSFGIAADTPGVCLTCGQECGICKCDDPIVF